MAEPERKGAVTADHVGRGSFRMQRPDQAAPQSARRRMPASQTQVSLGVMATARQMAVPLTPLRDCAKTTEQHTPQEQMCGA